MFIFLNLRKCLLQVIMKLAVARVTILSCLLRLGAGGLHHHDILFEPSHPHEEGLGGPGSSTADLTGVPGHSAAGLAGGPGHSAAGLTGGPGHSAAGLTGGPGHSAAELAGGPGHSAAGLTGGPGHSAASLHVEPAAQADSGLRHPVILVPGDGGSQVINKPAEYMLSCTVSIGSFCLFCKVAWPNCRLNENFELSILYKASRKRPVTTED
jgi:hypothetical protein